MMALRFTTGKHAEPSHSRYGPNPQIPVYGFQYEKYEAYAEHLKSMWCESPRRQYGNTTAVLAMQTGNRLATG